MENILVKIEGAVGVITLNRPKALNALNSALLAELCAAPCREQCTHQLSQCEVRQKPICHRSRSS